jgi:hypothetical protein
MKQKILEIIIISKLFKLFSILIYNILYIKIILYIKMDCCGLSSTGLQDVLILHLEAMVK